MNMELNDLKSTWQSVRSRIEETPAQNKYDRLISKKADIRRRFLARTILEIIISVICIALLSTSRLWAPMRLPVFWIAAWCVVLGVAAVWIAVINASVRRINLWEDSHAVIFSAIVRIRRSYRNMELTVCSLFLLLLVWLAFTPPFFNTQGMMLILVLTVACYGAEYLWYRSSMRHLSRIADWNNE